MWLLIVWYLDMPVMVDKPIARFTLQLVTMMGNIKRIKASVSVDIPNDRASLPHQPTMRDVVSLALKRQHPVIEYVVEQKGVLVTGYYEQYTFQQMMSCIEYSSDRVSKRIIP
ncbi:hypothetical protein GCM10027341_16760 [Spirosoma knui]